MKFLATVLAFAVSMCGFDPAFAKSNAKEYAAEFAFNKGSGFQNHQLGTTLIEEQVRELKLTYDFAVQGGAITTKYLLPVTSTPGRTGANPSPVLPKNAVIINCYIDVLTAGATSASGTIAISSGQAAADLKTATAAASYTGIVACIPTGSAASAIKLTADSNPYVAIATGAITAGKFNVHVLYVLSD